ncbi:hypothetical protein [Natrinema versiforme]|nr:hypothetical protein [Natrinema versiforme]
MRLLQRNRIVERHGGDSRVESESGDDSTVSGTLSALDDGLE